MRSAKAQDYWNNVYKRDYSDCLIEIDCQHLNNIPLMSLPRGPVVLCGLNGVGKSTVLSALKDLVGIPLSHYDKHRLNSHCILGKALVSDSEITCSNENGNRLINKGFDNTKFAYIDSTESMSVQNYFISQTHLDELLEQYEEFNLPSKSLEDLNYLVGKKYNSCTLRELTDTDGVDSTIPFFSVEIDGETYDSKSMGSGEHFLFYLFWRIEKADKETLLIVEEPETYISIVSQIHFINYLGSHITRKGIKVIISTHSPYILSCVRNESVRVISRVGNNVSIISPDEKLSAETILGLKERHYGTIFVEDKVASDLLCCILEDKCPHFLRLYNIESVGGEAEITTRLSFPRSDFIKYDFVGVYDGDMRKGFNSSNINWKYCFLPGSDAVEELFRNYMHSDLNISKLCSFLNVDKGLLIAMLSTIDGYDCHDWFIELMKYLATDGKTLVNAFYSTLMKEDPQIEVFVKEFKEAIEPI